MDMVEVQYGGVSVAERFEVFVGDGVVVCGLSGVRVCVVCVEGDHGRVSIVLSLWGGV